MLPQLEALLRASPKVASFQVIDNDPIDESNFLFKLRCELTSGRTLQIRLHATAGFLRYSYQELSNRPRRRWDNAPHFPHLPNFPHHHHSLQGGVVDSLLSGDPVAASAGEILPLHAGEVLPLRGVKRIQDSSTSDLLPSPSSASVGLPRATGFTDALPAAVILGESEAGGIDCAPAQARMP